MPGLPCCIVSGFLKSIINPLAVAELNEVFHNTSPFPSMVLDDFLDKDFAHAVAGAYPSYAQARSMGREFSAVNERFKIQVTEPSKFPVDVKRLADEICGASFISQLESITGIQNLVPDPRFLGGGMHITGAGGRLDVHVDFNFDEELGLHRRLNILIYLNEVWEDDWGGELELWDSSVTTCKNSILPAFNRCAVFATSESSFHGVQPVRCPDGVVRKSFAAYYYTKEAPADWDGQSHSTIFKARPSERIRKYVLMPSESFGRALAKLPQFIKKILRGLLR